MSSNDQTKQVEIISCKLKVYFLFWYRHIYQKYKNLKFCQREGSAVRRSQQIFPLEVFKANYCHCHDMSQLLLLLLRLSLFAHLNSHVNQLFPESIFPCYLVLFLFAKHFSYYQVLLILYKNDQINISMELDELLFFALCALKLVETSCQNHHLKNLIMLCELSETYWIFRFIGL